MADGSVPWYVTALSMAAGVALIGSGIPLWLRRVPRNEIYGVRFPSTLANDRVWYDINARGGRDLVVIGVVYLVLVTVMLTVGRTRSVSVRVFGPVTFLVVALIVDAVVLGVAASRA